jgi:hypothetical protein
MELLQSSPALPSVYQVLANLLRGLSRWSDSAGKKCTCAVPEPFAWAGWARASCGSVILVDQTAEYLSSADRGGQVDHLTRIVDGRPLFPTLVWTVAVVMSFVASEHST